MLSLLELGEELGYAERAMRSFVSDGMPVAQVGKRGKMFFDPVKCRAWIEAHRRTVVGEGRPRAAGDIEARKKRHEIGPQTGRGKRRSAEETKRRSEEKTPRAAEEAASGGTRKKKEVAAAVPDAQCPVPSDGLPDIADKTPGELLKMVADGEINPGIVSLFKQVLEAMELTAEFRLRMKQLVRVEDVEAEQKRRLVWARGILDRMPDSVVAAVSGVVPLDESQRHRVRENVRKEVDTVIDQLGGGKA